MARFRILRKDGSRSPYFWSDTDESGPERKTVYKKTPKGRTRMRGVYFDTVTKRMRKEVKPA